MESKSTFIEMSSTTAGTMQTSNQKISQLPVETGLAPVSTPPEPEIFIRWDNRLYNERAAHAVASQIAAMPGGLILCQPTSKPAPSGVCLWNFLYMFPFDTRIGSWAGLSYMLNISRFTLPPSLHTRNYLPLLH